LSPDLTGEIAAAHFTLSIRADNVVAPGSGQLMVCYHFKLIKSPFSLGPGFYLVLRQQQSHAGDWLLLFIGFPVAEREARGI